jgi:hypothetical protein
MRRRRKNHFRGEFDQRPENKKMTPEFFLCSAGAFPRRRNVMSGLLGVNISKQVAAYVLPFHNTNNNICDKTLNSFNY